VLASEWLIRVFGGANYSKMWGPLLKCKLGACREEASAAFIWSTISRLYSTREKDASKKERLGYVRGGYRTVVGRLISELESLGGTIVTGTTVESVTASGGGVEITTPGGSSLFESAISTVPSPVLAKIAPQLSGKFVKKLLQVKYLGVVCFVLVLKRALSPYYVTNLADEDLPFTGIIEMTNLISSEETAGFHLLYLPKYTSPGDPLFDASEDQIWQIFWTSLKRVFPDLSESDLESRFLFRERFVQPLPVIDYSELVPPMRTEVNGLLLANTTQIVNSTLNNNEMVKIAKRAVAIVTEDRSMAVPAPIGEFSPRSSDAIAMQS